MELKVRLPTRVEVSEYFEFAYMEDYYKQLNKYIKVKEVGFNGRYIGIAYYKKKDAIYKELERQVKAEERDYNNALDRMSVYSCGDR